MRRAPNYSLDPSPPQVRKRKSYYTRPIYYYFLFKQAWPLILVIVGIGLFLNYLVFTVGHDSVKGGQSWGSGAYGRANLALQDTKQLLQMRSSPGEQSVINVSQKQTQEGQRLIENSPLYGFVLFGSYRMDAKSIAAIGLSGVVLRDSKKLGACMWKERAGGHRVVSGQLHCEIVGTSRHAVLCQRFCSMSWIGLDARTSLLDTHHGLHGDVGSLSQV